MAASHFPQWIRRPLAVHGQWEQAKSVVKELDLHTVCQEARCPNLGECWSHGNVSFMILGDRCTRRCSFCAVETARPGPVDEQEPQRLAEAVAQLGLRYVVVTSVARDDLKDEGAGLFAESVRAIRRRCPETQVEVLTPDFHARVELIERVTQSEPAVYNHNLETVERLSPSVRPQADYRRSLQVLRLAKAAGAGGSPALRDISGQKLQGSPTRRLGALGGAAGMKTKSGLMVGLGETPEEVRQALADLRQVGCDILTIGQYLRPTPAHRPVHEFVPPEQFDLYRAWGEEMDFSFVASAPYVRSSYNAFEALRKENGCKKQTG